MHSNTGQYYPKAMLPKHLVHEWNADHHTSVAVYSIGLAAEQWVQQLPYKVFEFLMGQSAHSLKRQVRGESSTTMRVL